MIIFTHYIKNFDVFSKHNHGKNGLLSVEGFILLLVSTLLIGDKQPLQEFIAIVVQRDAASTLANILVISSVCLTVMILYYVVNAILLKDSQESLNNLSWTIITILMCSLIIFFMRTAGGLLRYLATNIADFEYIIAPIFITLIITYCSKIINHKDQNYFSFVRKNMTKIMLISTSSISYFVIASIGSA